MTPQHRKAISWSLAGALALVTVGISIGGAKAEVHAKADKTEVADLRRIRQLDSVRTYLIDSARTKQLDRIETRVTDLWCVQHRLARGCQ
jgi:hypothetical protein